MICGAFSENRGEFEVLLALGFEMCDALMNEGEVVGYAGGICVLVAKVL